MPALFKVANPVASVMLPELVQFTALSARNVPVMPDAIVILLAVVRVPLVTPMVEFEFIETDAVPYSPPPPPPFQRGNSPPGKRDGTQSERLRPAHFYMPGRRNSAANQFDASAGADVD